ncbi:uncharacterized protein LOC127850141 isoform X1 [Dreissena polymorpha]|uniref:uncharacterized protein LOC127850141 isoform X1 n=1 Tax=Dreissena polymorpha TaxID=45954 RepID=UPI0022649201|nr:uncharacterized protein LOC127850141 isoform X1 [Dreissena polymorpha]
MATKWTKRLTYVTIGLYFFMGGIEYAVILPTIWLYLRTDFNAEEYMLGLLLSGYSFAAIMSGPLLGRWSDRFRKPKILLIVGILFEVVGNIMYFMGISVWFLLASRLVAGVGGGAEAVLMAEVTRYSPEEKRTGIISILVAIRQTGLLVGPGLNLFLREMNFKVGSFEVTKYNVPGAFMACVWMLQLFILVFMYTDLHELNSDEVSTKSDVDLPTPEGHFQGNTTNIEYDDDIYREINGASNCDAKALNGVTNSRSPTADDLIENAEIFMTESEQSSRSHTPVSVNGEPYSRTLSGQSSSVPADGHIAPNSTTLVAKYGSVDHVCDDNQNKNNSVDHFDQRQASLEDYLQGKSKLRFIYQEYVREEIVTVIAVQFNSYFNQVALETMETPLSNKFLGWGELENSIMYCLAGVEIILVFLFVTWLSKRLADRYLILIGTLILTAANAWMIYVIPIAGNYDSRTNLWRLIIGIVLDMLALPLLVSGSIALYSKITRRETQGLSMGLRRSVVGIATILAPLWAGSTISLPYVMFGVMLGLLLMSSVMLLFSFKKLIPTNEQPVNKAGLVTATDSDDNIRKPLLS